jgi:hypothetical protein
VAEGALVLYFAQTTTLASAILVMVFFSLFVQAAEGSTYGIVPYVDPPTTGAIAGIVGAGGNLGAVCFSFGFRQLDYKNAFAIMGFATLGAAFFSVFILIKGHAGMFCGKDEDRRQAVTEELFTPYSNRNSNASQRKRGSRGQEIDSDSDSSSDSECSSDEEEEDDDFRVSLNRKSPSPIGGVGNLAMISPIIEEEGDEESEAQAEEKNESTTRSTSSNGRTTASGLQDETN